MKRHTKMLAAALAAAGLALTACGGGSSSGGAPGSESAGGNTITWAVWNYDKTPEFGALKAACEAAVPGLQVQVVDSLADDYATQLNTRLAAGDKTDVITMKTMTDYSRLGLKGQLVDISDMASGQEDQLQGLDAYNLEDKYYAMPYRTDIWALFYNKDIFDAAGQPYPTEMSWDEFVDLSKKLTGTKPDGQPQYGTYFHKWSSLVQAPQSVQLDKDLNTPDYAYLEPAYNRALELVDAKAMHSQADVTSGNLAYKTEFEQGNAAMVPMGTWLVGALIADTKAGTYTGNWGIAPLPQQSASDPVATPGGPTGLGINKNSENQAAARKFIECATGETGAKALAGIGMLPALTSDAVTDAYFAVQGMPTDPGSKDALTPDRISLEIGVSENATKINKILQDQHDLIMNQQVSVSEGLQQMQEEVQSVVG